jgi:8-oxo-dGTP pyrophosphatase MutT (NUDIX family)
MSEFLAEELSQILAQTSDYDRVFEREEKNQASVLALFFGTCFLNSEILLILRSDGLLQNPGQVALPGGSLESIDQGKFARAALRETREEVGIDPVNIQVLGDLPPLTTVTGQFEVHPVLGIWTGQKKPALVLETNEVADAEWVSVQSLRESRGVEKRMVHGVEMVLPVFYWKERRVWGLTAMIFDLILKRYDNLFP